MRNPETYEDLKAEVDKRGGVWTVPMSVLRDIHGASRLGVNVRDNISQELAGHGLAHYPERLPDSQNASARVYRQGSAIASIIKAVLDVTEKTDETLRKSGGGEAEKQIAKIREILEG